MAFTMSGEERIAAPLQKVWDALNHPLVLQKCIPGCEALEKTGDDTMSATVVLKIGPLKAKFAGRVTLTNLDPPNGYTITGEGQGGIAGFAKGGADVSLSAEGPETTVLSYSTRADVGGKIAQLGSRLIDSTAQKLAGQFFANLAREIGMPAEA